MWSFSQAQVRSRPGKAQLRTALPLSGISEHHIYTAFAGILDKWNEIATTMLHHSAAVSSKARVQLLRGVKFSAGAEHCSEAEL